MARRSRFNAPPDPPPPTTAQPQAAQQTDEQPQNANEPVRGPTSALTSFLRQQGIRPRHTNPYARAADSEAGPSGATTPNDSGITTPAVIEEEDEDIEEPPPEAEEDPDSDDIDGHQPPVASTSRAIPAARASSSKRKKIATSSSPETKASKKPKKGEDSDYDDGPPPVPKPGRYADRKPGMIAICGECGKKFCVSKYTPQNHNGRGQLCDACSKESVAAACARGAGNMGNKPPAKKKRVQKKKGKDESKEIQVPTLQLSCIKVVAKHIEEMEQLGDVGLVNLDRICKIVCKHRALLPKTLPLFLDMGHSILQLYDCIHLQSEQLISIASFCSHLQRLTLNLCGHLDGDVLAVYRDKLLSLRYLELHGPYLVRTQHWQDLFSTWKSSGRGETMQGFLLKQSPRFDLACVAGLVGACPNLTELRLADIGLLDDTALGLLHGLTQLTTLDIANAGIKNGTTGEFLTDDGVVALLAAVGGTLEKLNLSENRGLTDRTLLEGIKPHCPKLRFLNLHLLGELTTAGVTQLFTDWTANKGLQELSLSRCIRVGDEGLNAVVEHSGETLQKLDLNSVDELREEGLNGLAKGAPEMRELDVGFVREIEDFILKAFLDGMPHLRVCRVAGNNRVSDYAPHRPGLKLVGQERAITIEG